nr:hypothetical protein [Tanacetum cinerariifolium]
DVAVFTGEETPRRAILPNRLINDLPGIFGPQAVAAEQKRLANVGLPMREQPEKVSASANMETADMLVDPLHGYAYDSFNEDALLRLAKVENGRIAGGWVLLNRQPSHSPSFQNYPAADAFVQQEMLKVTGLADTVTITDPISHDVKGLLLRGPYNRASFASLGLAPDVLVTNPNSQRANGIAWTHRTAPEFDIYFISNQLDSARTI